MAIIDIKLDPSPKELRVFALLWLAFFALLGLMSLGKPEALLAAAAVTGLAFVVSITLNGDYPRKLQLFGLLIPGALLLIGGLERVGVPAMAVAGTVGALGVLGCVVTLAQPAAGRRLYTGWMYAALPIGWTISHLLLAGVYYLLFTPIGLVMRALGRDPMRRKFDRQATTYWIARSAPADRARYFRQF